MPDNSFKRTLITSALPYANGYIHLGHLAGAYLPADIYTRFLRSCGQDVIHVSGSDEHGVPIVLSADQEGVPPQQIVDKYHPDNEAAFRALGIDFDIFGRTTWPEHHQTAQEFFTALYGRGYLSEHEEDQFYDATAGQFLPDRYVEGTCPNCGYESARGDQCDNCSATYNQTALKNPVSKISGHTPEVRRTKHLYFDLSRFQDRLEQYIEKHAPEWRNHVVQQSRSWLKAGLGQRAITRDLAWGVDVPVPGYQGKKLYVWFDAPFGYITNTKVLMKQRTGHQDAWKDWWCSADTRYVAFIGKDNIVFHTLMFPAMLMGYNELDGDQYVLPDNVPACEFLNLEGQKFSKSRHWGIDLRDYVAAYPADPLRYTLAANLPENKDVDFTWREYQARNNNELANILGNFVNRTTQFAARYFQGVVPPLAPADKQADLLALLTQDLRHAAQTGQDTEAALHDLWPKYMKYFSQNDLTMLLALARYPAQIAALYQAFRFREAALETMNLARDANKYFNDAEPWKTRTDDPARCAATVNICLQTMRALAILFQPITPFSATAIWAMLNLEPGTQDTWWTAGDICLPTGHTLGQPVILFSQVDDATVESEVAKLGASPAGSSAPANEATAPQPIALKPQITIDDFGKSDLRVATVTAAERVKRSEKLLKLQIRIGDLQRQILAGVGKKYQPEDLVGKRIVVVANLKPAKLMGEASEGMLLAANPPEPEALPTVLIVPDDVPEGSVVR